MKLCDSEFSHKFAISEVTESRNDFVLLFNIAIAP
jgi:hypothetical protein